MQSFLKPLLEQRLPSVSFIIQWLISWDFVPKHTLNAKETSQPLHLLS